MIKDQRNLVLEGFYTENKYLKFKKPLHLKIEESDSSLVARIPQLMINVYAEQYEELIDRINDELSNKWQWIVDCEDDNLVSNAKEVKYNFLDIVETPIA